MVNEWSRLLRLAGILRSRLNSSQVAFKTFLNITPTLSFPPASAPPSNPSLPQPSEFILTLDDNPLAEFADLPRDAKEGGLWFSNVLCGVIRGALEMVSPYSYRSYPRTKI